MVGARRRVLSLTTVDGPVRLCEMTPLPSPVTVRASSVMACVARAKSKLLTSPSVSVTSSRVCVPSPSADTVMR